MADLSDFKRGQTVSARMAGASVSKTAELFGVVKSTVSKVMTTFEKKGYWLVGRLVGFYGISTFVGYLTPNPFLFKLSVLFQTIQFSMSTQSNCQKHFYFKLFNFVKQF